MGLILRDLLSIAHLIGLLAVDVFVWVCAIIAVSAFASSNRWNDYGGIGVVFAWLAVFPAIVSRLEGGPRWLSAAGGAAGAAMLYCLYG